MSKTIRDRQSYSLILPVSGTGIYVFIYLSFVLRTLRLLEFFDVELVFNHWHAFFVPFQTVAGFQQSTMSLLSEVYFIYSFFPVFDSALYAANVYQQDKALMSTHKLCVSIKIRKII